MKWPVAPVSATLLSEPSVILMHSCSKLALLQLELDREAVEAVASSDLEDVRLLVMTVASSSSWGGYGQLLLAVGVG
jgi:hypothetical protein